MTMTEENSSNSSSTLLNNSNRAPIADAFSYYSNDRNRMKTLLLANEQDANVFDNTIAEAFGLDSTTGNKMLEIPTQATARSAVRKTKVSFEVHPSLVWLTILNEIEE